MCAASLKKEFLVSLRQDVSSFCQNLCGNSLIEVNTLQRNFILKRLCFDSVTELCLLVVDGSIFYNSDDVTTFVERNESILPKMLVAQSFDTPEEVVVQLEDYGVETFVIPCERDFFTLREKIVKDSEELKELPVLSEDKRRILSEVRGSSSIAEKLRQQIYQASLLDCSVILEGETGTGKTFIAEKIHRLSKRASHNFVPLYVPDLTDSLVESQLFGTVDGAFTDARARHGFLGEADKGTLCLDELSEMKLEVQTKFLQVLDSGGFHLLGDSGLSFADVRFMAATNANIMELIRQKRFRSDLYYRLEQNLITVPSLRQRKEDIPEIIQGLSEQFNIPKYNFSSDAMEVMMDYDWPGNIRELKNVLIRMTSDSVKPEIDSDTISRVLSKSKKGFY